MTGLPIPQSDNGDGVHAKNDDEHRPHFAVLADDLTGAADAAVALAGPACDVEIHLDLRYGLRTESTVMAVDLDTRRMPVGAARDVTLHCASVLASSHRHLFKKIDSTLRGHIGAELAALYQHTRSRRGPPSNGRAYLCIVAPAHPTMGRIIRYGRLEMRGTSMPLGEPRNGFRTRTPGAADRDTLKAQLQACGFACTPLHIDRIRSSSPEQLTQLIANSALHDMPALVCDGESTEDLLCIIRAALASATQCIWVGSGGLAQALAAFHAPTYTGPGASPRPFMDATRGSRLFVVGSYSLLASQQVDALVASGEVGLLTLTAEDLLDKNLAPQRQRLDTWVKDGRDMVVTIKPDGPIRPELSLRLAAGLAELVVPVVGHLGALICCGGDTSRALFDALGLVRIHARQSDETGITYIHADTWPTLPIVLKAGAFGDAQTLARLRHRLASPPLDVTTSQRRKHT
jgi:4-hydroxythreonine-4-phosphate dehydrogenase